MTKQNTPGAFLKALKTPPSTKADRARKLRVNLDVDADILAHFPGSGSERKEAIHRVLRDYVDGMNE